MKPITYCNECPLIGCAEYHREINLSEDMVVRIPSDCPLAGKRIEWPPKIEVEVVGLWVEEEP